MSQTIDAAHFKRRRLQFSLIALVLVGTVLAICLAMFKRDIDQASLDQKWALWRDDHCSSDTLSQGKAAASFYQEHNYRGRAGTWRCDDGRVFDLGNSDQAPQAWVASMPRS